MHPLKLRAVLAMTLLGATAQAGAHTVWLEADSAHAGDYRVMFGGHAGKTESYDAAKLGAIAAQDATGKPVALHRRDGADGVRLSPAARPALLTVAFDNGYWSKTAKGKSVNRPMTEVPDAVSGVHAVKYHKTIVQWTDAVIRATGQAFELVPLSASAPRAGQPLQLRVLIDGKPAAGIKLAFGEEGSDAVSDGQGVASIVPRPGINRLWAGQRQNVQGDPRLTEISVEYSLVFTAR